MSADMRTWQRALLLATILLAACGCQRSSSSTPKSPVQVEAEVLAFMSVVAHDVTQNGPTAWRQHFADSPSFFMAVDGQMAFPNSAAATAGIQAVARDLPHIELQWGADLRVDPLAPKLAMVATSYHEVQVNKAGNRLNQSGFFTAVTEYRGGRWQFRNAHWSEPVPPPAVP